MICNQLTPRTGLLGKTPAVCQCGVGGNFNEEIWWKDTILPFSPSPQPKSGGRNVNTDQFKSWLQAKGFWPAQCLLLISKHEEFYMRSNIFFTQLTPLSLTAARMSCWDVTELGGELAIHGPLSCLLLTATAHYLCQMARIGSSAITSKPSSLRTAWVAFWSS